MQIGEVTSPLIDGGVVAKNPTACAIAEAVLLNSPAEDSEPAEIEDFVVASLGTGESKRRILPTEAQEWGALEWAVPIVDVLFDGSADAVHYIATQLMKPDGYFRFQTPLDSAYDDLDRADQVNLEALCRIAVNYIDGQNGQKQLEGLVKSLRHGRVHD
jgi:hypothetical protein